ncbi:MAG: hypothetical protein ACRDA4_08050 [Filifactoraceae bacterium]
MSYAWNDSGIIVPGKKEAELCYKNSYRKKFIDDVDKANEELVGNMYFSYPKWLVDEISNAGYDVEIVEVNSGADYRNAGEFDYVKGYISWI